MAAKKLWKSFAASSADKMDFTLEVHSLKMSPTEEKCNVYVVFDKSGGSTENAGVKSDEVKVNIGAEDIKFGSKLKMKFTLYLSNGLYSEKNSVVSVYKYKRDRIMTLLGAITLPLHHFINKTLPMGASMNDDCLLNTKMMSNLLDDANNEIDISITYTLRVFPTDAESWKSLLKLQSSITTGSADGVTNNPEPNSPGSADASPPRPGLMTSLSSAAITGAKNTPPARVLQKSSSMISTRESDAANFRLKTHASMVPTTAATTDDVAITPLSNAPRGGINTASPPGSGKRQMEVMEVDIDGGNSFEVHKLKKELLTLQKKFEEVNYQNSNLSLDVEVLKASAGMARANQLEESLAATQSQLIDSTQKINELTNESAELNQEIITQKELHEQEQSVMLQRIALLESGDEARLEQTSVMLEHLQISVSNIVFPPGLLGRRVHLLHSTLHAANSNELLQSLAQPLFTNDTVFNAFLAVFSNNDGNVSQSYDDLVEILAMKEGNSGNTDILTVINDVVLCIDIKGGNIQAPNDSMVVEFHPRAGNNLIRMLTKAIVDCNKDEVLDGLLVGNKVMDCIYGLRTETSKSDNILNKVFQMFVSFRHDYADVVQHHENILTAYKQNCRAAMNDEMEANERALEQAVAELHKKEQQFVHDSEIQAQIVQSALQQERELNMMTQKYNMEVVKNQEFALRMEELQTKLREYESDLLSVEEYQQQMSVWYRQHEAVRVEKDKLEVAKSAPPTQIKNAAELLYRENELFKREAELKERETKLLLKQKRNEANRLQRKINRNYDGSGDAFDEDHTILEEQYKAVNEFTQLMIASINEAEDMTNQQKLDMAYDDIRLLAKRIQELQHQLRGEDSTNKSLVMQNTVLRDEIDQLNDELELKARELEGKDVELREELFAKEEYWNLQMKELEIKKKLAAFQGIEPEYQNFQASPSTSQYMQSSSMQSSPNLNPYSMSTGLNEYDMENRPGAYTNISEFIHNSLHNIDNIHASTSNTSGGNYLMNNGALTHPLHVAMKQPEKFVHSSQFLAKYSAPPNRPPVNNPSPSNRPRASSPTPRMPIFQNMDTIPLNNMINASPPGKRMPPPMTQPSPQKYSPNVYNIIDHLTTTHTIASKVKLLEKTIPEKKEARGFKFTTPNTANKKFM